MDTGNIMENQLQDQYDGFDNEQREKAIEEAQERQWAIADRLLARIKSNSKKDCEHIFKISYGRTGGEKCVKCGKRI